MQEDPVIYEYDYDLPTDTVHENLTYWNYEYTEIIKKKNSMTFGYDVTGVMVLYFAMGVLALLGIVGNVLSIVVWTRWQMKSTTAVLLTAIGFGDTISILFSYPRQFLCVLIANGSKSIDGIPNTYFVIHQTLKGWIKWTYIVSCIGQTMSTHLTLAITMERYIAISYPLQYKRIISYSLALKTTATITIFSIVYNVARYWFCPKGDLSSSADWTGIRTPDIRFIMVYEENYNSQMTFYLIWLDTLIVYLIPLATITICNTANFITLKKANRKRRGIAIRQTLTDFQKKENRLTKMLVYVVFEFLICSSVNGYVGIANIVYMMQFKKDDYMYKPHDLPIATGWLIPVGTFLDMFNASANFLSYVAFGKPFRKTLVKTLCCCCWKEPQEISLGNQQPEKEGGRLKREEV